MPSGSIRRAWKDLPGGSDCQQSGHYDSRDLEDIRAIFKVHRASLDMDELREYFALFDKPELLHELLG